MKNDDDGCLWLTIALLAIPFALMLRGWVLLKMWAWFVLPLGAPYLMNLWHAVGLSAVVSIMAAGSSSSDEDDSAKATAVKALARMIFLPLFMLAFGWLVQKAMVP